MLSKEELRYKNISIRKSLNITDISKLILEKLYKLNCFQKAKSVFTYISLPDEIDTKPILLIRDKKIFVPKIINDNIIFSKYDKNNLTINKYGILEPKEYIKVCPQNSDIIIIPALAADINFNRIGYGGGYYDRFLKNAAGIKIALLPDEFIYNSICTNENDIPVDIIISENRILNNINNR